jgi:hypothetical protein
LKYEPTDSMREKCPEKDIKNGSIKVGWEA